MQPFHNPHEVRYPPPPSIEARSTSLQCFLPATSSRNFSTSALSNWSSNGYRQRQHLTGHDCKSSGIVLLARISPLSGNSAFKQPQFCAPIVIKSVVACQEYRIPRGFDYNRVTLGGAGRLINKVAAKKKDIFEMLKGIGRGGLKVLSYNAAMLSVLARLPHDLPWFNELKSRMIFLRCSNSSFETQHLAQHRSYMHLFRYTLQIDMQQPMMECRCGLNGGEMKIIL